MKINEEPYEESKTSSIYTFGIHDEFDLVNDQKKLKNYFERKGDRTSKQLFKDLYGKQQTVVQYTNRNWVWTFSSENACLYVLCSKTGRHLEARRDSDHEELRTLVNNIIGSLYD